MATRNKWITQANVEQMVQHYKPIVGLADWTHSVAGVTVLRREDEPTARVIYQPSSRHFKIEFNRKKFGHEGQYGYVDGWWYTFAHTVVHELWHVVWSPAMTVYERVAVQALGSQEALDLLQVGLYNVEDPIIDRIADITLAAYPPPRRER